MKTMYRFLWMLVMGIIPVSLIASPGFLESRTPVRNDAQVIIHVELTCSAQTTEGAFVQLQNLTIPDTVYSTTMTSSGTVTFPNVLEGDYLLTITKTGYQVYNENKQISGQTSINVTLMKIKYPPSNLSVDNHSLIATWIESNGPDPCITGYNFYLGGTLIGLINGTTFAIPPTSVRYGQSYMAKVCAVYENGNSALDSTTFTSYYLAPVRDLEGETGNCFVHLTWSKPLLTKKHSDKETTEVKNERSPVCERGPNNSSAGNTNYTDQIWDLLFTWTTVDIREAGLECDGQFVYTSQWGADSGYAHFTKYDMMTGNFIESFVILPCQYVRDMGYDGQFYYGGRATNTLFKMDLANHTMVNSITTAVPVIRHIAYDSTADSGNGGFWVGNWYDIYLIGRNGNILSTGPALNNVFGSAYDGKSPNGPYLWTFGQTGAHFCDLTQYKITSGTLTPTGMVHDAGNVPGWVDGDVAGGLCTAKVNNKLALIGDIQGYRNIIFALEIADWDSTSYAPVLLGYNIYRDNVKKDSIEYPDTLSYFDWDVVADAYNYEVTAVYDLTPAGFPGQKGESLPAGPLYLDVLCGSDLPFFEGWGQGSFGVNDWDFFPSQGNWQISSTNGHPAPSASFSGLPPVTGYGNSLTTPFLFEGSKSPGKVWLDFDYMLDNNNPTGSEKLNIEAYYSGIWHSIAEYTNASSAAWTHQHLDITAVKGESFKIRFRANGATSTDIQAWYMDNISIFTLCDAPKNLAQHISDKTVLLTWDPATGRKPTVMRGNPTDLKNSPDSSILAGYNVFRKDEASDYSKLNSSYILTNQYADTTPDYKKYWYFVTAVYTDLPTGNILCESATDTILANVLAGFKTLEAGAVRIYPNPVKDVINIAADEQILSVKVIGFTGQTVLALRPVSSPVTVDVSGLANGIYFITVETAKGITTQKISVIH